MKNSTRILDNLVSKFRGTWIHYVFKSLRSLKRRLMRRSDGEAILLQRYSRIHGKPLNLAKPETFSEKLFCRMITLNRRGNHLFTQVSDKFMAREYVRLKVGKEHLVKLIWHGEDPREIPFDNLPNEYVIKTNHATKQIIVVKGYADRIEIIKKLLTWLECNYYWSCREYQYFNIKPRILIEEYLKNQDGSGPLDYRFYCFNGVPEVIQVDNHAHDINPFFDTKWTQLDLHYREGVSRPTIAKPMNLDRMIVIASKLSADFDFVRIDLYNIEGKIYFGEFTLTPTGGDLKLRPESWDMKLGEKWKMLSERFQY
jgi:hypothetical protein